MPTAAKDSPEGSAVLQTLLAELAIRRGGVPLYAARARAKIDLELGRNDRGEATSRSPAPNSRRACC